MGLSLVWAEDRSRCTVTTEGEPAGKIAGLRVPSDKSLTHRALMFAAVAKGATKIERPLWGADCRSTLAAFETMGVSVARSETAAGVALTVSSPGLNELASPETPLDFGNSGTTARLLTGLFSGVDGLFVTAFGDHSLSGRPMGRVTRPLRAMGAKIAGRAGGDYLPLAITGQPLRPSRHVVDKASAQVKSALLLASLQVEGEVEVDLPIGSRDHTERYLKERGAPLDVCRGDGRERLVFKGPWLPAARDVTIPADPSSAAFFAVLPCLFPGLRLELLDVLDNDTRCGFVDVLRRMGLDLVASHDAGADFVEPVQSIEVASGKALKAVEVSATELPTLIDEVPILAVASAFAEGTSRFRDLRELRVKESDRLAKTAELLTKGGAKVDIVGDDLLVTGPLRQVRSFDYDPAYDHRLAMAATILATRASGPCVVHSPDCVDVSFPGFYEQLRRLW